jgi:hypothetical protein
VRAEVVVERNRDRKALAALPSSNCRQDPGGRNDLVVRAEKSQLNHKSLLVDRRNEFSRRRTVSRFDAVVHENKPSSSPRKTEGPGQEGSD